MTKLCFSFFALMRSLLLLFSLLHWHCCWCWKMLWHKRYITGKKKRRRSKEDQDEEEPVEQKLECVLRRWNKKKELARVNTQQGFSYVLRKKEHENLITVGVFRTEWDERFELLWKEKKNTTRKVVKYFSLCTSLILFTRIAQYSVLLPSSP